jgi:hypothetical protein
MVVNYNYCLFATHDPSTNMTIPCDATLFGDDAALLNQVDYNDPWYVALWPWRKRKRDSERKRKAQKRRQPANHT